MYQATTRAVAASRAVVDLERVEGGAAQMMLFINSRWCLMDMRFTGPSPGNVPFCWAVRVMG